MDDPFAFLKTPEDRLRSIPGFDIDRVAQDAGTDPDVLRMENLDTDFPPPPAALEATLAAIESGRNSYLPFTGSLPLRKALSEEMMRRYSIRYDPGQIVITCGGTEALLDVLLAGIQPGAGVVVTDPTYAGIINRIRLAGGVPHLVPFEGDGQGWKLNLDVLIKTSSQKNIRMMLLMSPSMPSGAVLSSEDWQLVEDLCTRHNLLLVYDAAMERLLFDGREVCHPLQYAGLRDRTAVVGSFSKEFRMISWRVGWAAAAPFWAERISRTHIFNAVTISSFAQEGALAALRNDDAFPGFLGELERRRDLVLSQLSDFQLIPPAGGWSMLLNTSGLGLSARELSQKLLEKGRVAATPMDAWGLRDADKLLRLVFSLESVERLGTLRERFLMALD